MCKRLLLINGLLGALACSHAMAKQDLIAYSASAQAVYTKIKASGESFSPSLLQLKGEVAFTDGLMDGIGLQALIAAPMSDAKENNLTMDVKQQSGIYLTLTSPDTQPEDLKVSVLLGYASTELETNLPSLGNLAKNKDTFSDFSYGVSLQDRIMRNKNFYWTLDYLRYYKDDHLTIDGFGLGVTYAF
ncbi:outer membrane beta-barrel protein [Cellvibrio sp. pealriver]|uniref:outer membrane beta-barrel protein n=1 Tax=Cellvibrio sp. pealriver TaxID=1622269 RepID=UPI00066FBC0A|nr:outer membrane beta-barrel protein [Cellvibrio sp. pealriver]